MFGYRLQDMAIIYKMQGAYKKIGAFFRKG